MISRLSEPWVLRSVAVVAGLAFGVLALAVAAFIAEGRGE